MTDKNKTGQIPAIRVDPDLMAKIDADAEASFDSVAEVVRRRLAMAYSDGAPLVVTAAQELRNRKEELAIEKMERDAARERKELIAVEEAMAVVDTDYSQIRQSLLALARTARIECALSDDQFDKLEALTQNLMTDLSGEQPETFDDIAKR